MIPVLISPVPPITRTRIDTSVERQTIIASEDEEISMKENQSATVDLARIESAVREILSAIGENPDREGLIKTPSRVARAYSEMMSGMFEDPRAHLKTVFPRTVRRSSAIARHRIQFGVRASPVAVHW